MNPVSRRTEEYLSIFSRHRLLLRQVLNKIMLLTKEYFFWVGVAPFFSLPPFGSSPDLDVADLIVIIKESSVCVSRLNSARAQLQGGSLSCVEIYEFLYETALQ